MRLLSSQTKINWLPDIIGQQGGFFCLFCKSPFPSMKDVIYAHLNNNKLDNRKENLGLVHQECNIKQVTWVEYQLIANDQLEKNESRIYLREKNHLEDKSTGDHSTEITVNVNNYKIVEQYLVEHISTDHSIPELDTLDDCVYLCKTMTGHGSHQSVRNYLKTLTCAMAPFMVVTDEKTKKRMIVKRTGN